MTGALIVADLETTGLDCRSAGVVELGAVAIIDGAIVSEFTTLAWPGLEYVKTESHWRVLNEVSGISPALLLDAPHLGQVSDRFLRWAMRELGELPLPVTSFNRNFDQPFVKAHLPRVHERLAWGECLMHRSQRALGLSRWPSLGRACEAFGIARDGQHRALDDARAAAALFLALEGRHG